MIRWLAFALLLSPSPGWAETPWVETARSAGVAVYARDRAGSGVREVRAVGVIDAPPAAVFRVLTDYERYRETMPYTAESRVLRTEEGGRVVHFYSVIDAPLVSPRDYTLRIVDESDWRDGAGYLRTRWSLSPLGPPPREGVVRVTVDDGSWTLEPVGGGAETRATYLLFTDPGGWLPAFVVNRANSSALLDLFAALRRRAKEPPYADR